MEAVISFFNPEMIPEWKVLHGAEYRLGFDPEKAAARWSLVVPGDDGTFAALITALRLTGGDHEAPLADGTLAVERLGGPGAAVGVRREPAKGVALASSRAVLEGAGLDPPELPALADTLESGLVFQVDPGRLAPPGNANLFLRRAVVLARGLGCRRRSDRWDCVMIAWPWRSARSSNSGSPFRARGKMPPRSTRRG